ncbi:MAG: aminotransferase class V-fold PLP-dependent enzyme [Candidatus Thorarchaeota archaeon]
MSRTLDVKSDFDIYKEIPLLAYFDSSSTTLIPRVAVDATTEFLSHIVVSSRKGAHRLAVKGATVVEESRKKLAEFFSVQPAEMSFQKSLPCAVSSIAFGYKWKEYGQSKIVIGQSEENSVYVPLLRAAQVLGLDVEIVPTDDDGLLDLSSLDKTLDDQVGIVAIGTVAPGIGRQNPIDSISKTVHEHRTILLTDATRSVGASEISLTSINSDVVLFSGNIGLMAPPGFTVQWTNPIVNEIYHPGIIGGSGVAGVEDKSFEIALPPDRYESGYINIPAIAGLGASLDYLSNLNSQGLFKHMRTLSSHLLSRLREFDGIKIYGTPSDRNTIIGFDVSPESDISCHDIALFLDESDIAVRSGLICAHPLLNQLTRNGLVQVSLHVYNTLEDIDRLCQVLDTILSELV